MTTSLEYSAASSVSGGDGDDTIDVDAVATDNKGGHSIFGGAGADVFELLTSTHTAENRISPRHPTQPA